MPRRSLLWVMLCLHLVRRVLRYLCSYEGKSLWFHPVFPCFTVFHTHILFLKADPTVFIPSLFLTLLVICQNNTEEERRSVHLLHAQTPLALGVSWHELSFQVLSPLWQLLALCVGKDLLGWADNPAVHSYTDGKSSNRSRHTDWPSCLPPGMPGESPWHEEEDGAAVCSLVYPWRSGEQSGTQGSPWGWLVALTGAKVFCEFRSWKPCHSIRYEN